MRCKTVSSLVRRRSRKFNSKNVYSGSLYNPTNTERKTLFPLQLYQPRLFSSNSDSNKLPSNTPASNPIPVIEQKESLPADTFHIYDPIDFDVACHIEGSESQVAFVRLYPNQKLRAETGAMLYMTEGIEMNTTLGGKDSVSSGLKRVMTGQNLFLADFTYTGTNSGEVALGTDFPSKILKFDLDQYNNRLICQKGAFLCASADSVSIDMEFTKKFTTGFFGGEGFILQSLKGTGHALLKAGGTVVRRDLKPGENLRVSSGSLVCFTDGVEYDVQMVKGFQNVMFGGEGLFFTTLTGPGTVWLQGMPPDRMISEIARRVPSGGMPIGIGVPIMGVGGGGVGDGTSVGDSGAMAAAVVADSAPSIVGTEQMDATVNADRQATVASSGMMGNPDSVGAEPSAFSDFATKDDFASNQEPMLEDELAQDSFSKEEVPKSDFQDESIEFGGDESGSVDEASGSKGFLGSMWDLFTNNEE